MWLFYFCLISVSSLRTAYFLHNQKQDVDLKDKNRNTRIIKSKYAWWMPSSIALVAAKAALHWRVSCKRILITALQWKQCKCCERRDEGTLLALMNMHCCWCHCREPLESHYTTFPFINQTLFLSPHSHFLLLILALSVSLSPSHVSLYPVPPPLSLSAVFNVPAVLTPQTAGAAL